MKRFKYWIIAIILIILALYGFYRYKLNQFYSLNNIDREFIISTFGPESDNRGFGDEGYRQMTEDLVELNNDPKIAKLYSRMLKQNRSISLSTNQQEYWQNIAIDTKISKCLTKRMIIIKKETGKTASFDLFIFKTSKPNSESRKFNQVSEVLSKKYHQGMKYEDVYAAVNARPSDLECEEFSK